MREMMKCVYYLLYFLFFLAVSSFLILLTVPVNLQPSIVPHFIRQLQGGAPVNLTVAYWQDQRNESDLLLKLGPQIPNLPLDFLYANMKTGRKMNDSCAKLPNLFDLHFNNYWPIG